MKREHNLNGAEYFTLIENPTKLKAYCKKYGYTGYDTKCLLCGLNLASKLRSWRHEHMQKFHPEIPDERNQTRKVNATQQLYRPTQSRLRGVSCSCKLLQHKQRLA